MLRALGALSALALTVFLLFLAWAHRPALPEQPVPGAFPAALVARGAGLAELGDCDSCHTIVPLTRFAGGRPVASPFGSVAGANITPDPETGIGRWPLAAFSRALREGVSRDGRHLYPIFPYDHFTRLSDGDVAALYAYLMTRPPVHARAPRPRLVPPLGFRPLLAGWKALFFRPARLTPDPSHDPVRAQGRYLVAGIAHCGSCHTPRNALGAGRSDRAFAGGEAEDWMAPPLAGRYRRDRAWSAAEIENYLRTGRAPNGKAARGPMADVVSHLSRAPGADVHAIAVHVADIMASGSPVPSR